MAVQSAALSTPCLPPPVLPTSRQLTTSLTHSADPAHLPTVPAAEARSIHGHHRASPGAPGAPPRGQSDSNTHVRVTRPPGWCVKADGREGQGSRLLSPGLHTHPAPAWQGESRARAARVAQIESARCGTSRADMGGRLSLLLDTGTTRQALPLRGRGASLLAGAAPALGPAGPQRSSGT